MSFRVVDEVLQLKEFKSRRVVVECFGQRCLGEWEVNIRDVTVDECVYRIKLVNFSKNTVESRGTTPALPGAAQQNVRDVANIILGKWI